MIYALKRTRLMVAQRSILVTNLDAAVSGFLLEALDSEGYRVCASAALSSDLGSLAQYDLVIVGLHSVYPTNTAAMLQHMQRIAATQTAALLVCATDPRLITQLDADYSCYTLRLPCKLDQLYDTVAQALSLR